MPFAFLSAAWFSFVACTLLVGGCAEEGADEVAGTIRLAPGVEAKLAESDAVFVVARQPGSAGGPPLAVVKLLGGTLPLSYRIGQEDVLMPGTFFKEPVQLRVVVRRSGVVGAPSPTDLEGEASGPVSPGSKGIEILLRPPR